MAEILPAKGPSETVTRRWAVTVAEGDGLASVGLVASGVTASAELDGQEVVLTLSGGTAGATASVVVTVATDLGNSLVETLYIPVIAPGGAAITAQDVVSFALRKVTGTSETPDSDQAADALEKLADMLEEWRVTGADVGSPRPLLLTSILYVPFEYVAAIKNNLIIRLSDQYGADLLTPAVQMAAMRGLQLVKASKRPHVEPEYY